MIRRWLRVPWHSPVGLVLHGLLFLGLFLACHLAGWRDCTTILSGTSPTGDIADKSAQLRGILYVLTWFGALLLTPIFLIAAGLVALCNRLKSVSPV
jgi:TRAP-type C4-dicarboxylate transport system permease small subunit